MSIIVDIDGTIADNIHRQNLLLTEPKNWDAFFIECYNDDPILPVIDIIQILDKHHSIIIVTGRPEKYRELTKLWLKKYNVPYDDLYMRNENDYRPDHIIKQEILTLIREKYNNVMLAIDDRQEVVDMWRRNGLICLQNEPKVK